MDAISGIGKPDDYKKYLIKNGCLTASYVRVFHDRSEIEREMKIWLLQAGSWAARRKQWKFRRRCLTNLVEWLIVLGRFDFTECCHSLIESSCRRLFLSCDHHFVWFVQVYVNSLLLCNCTCVWP